MSGHYVFNASAIGLGGVLTLPKRKVIPSIASVALAPTGGEGSAIVTNYDEDDISFDSAETHVWGSNYGNFYATRADVVVNNLNLFGEFQVESMLASVTTLREVVGDDVIDHQFTFKAEYIGVRIGQNPIEIPTDTTIFDDNPSYEGFLDALCKPEMKEYRGLIGMSEPDSDPASRRGRGKKRQREAQAVDPKTICCTAVSTRGNSGFHLPVDKEKISTVHLAEALVKPGRRRLTLLRIDLKGKGLVPASDVAMPFSRDLVPLMRGGPGGGAMSVGSVEGNGTNTWP